MNTLKAAISAGIALLTLIAATPVTAAVREYCIAAEDVQWDYAPSFPVNPMMGEMFTPEQRVFVEGDGATRIGHVYYKALYRRYARKGDRCDWRTLVDGGRGIDEAVDSRAGTEREHLGLLGPVIRGVVGDTIKVYFLNRTSSQTLSVHPHGVFYDKKSEGAPYDDGSGGAGKKDDMVPAGNWHTYVWEVPERAGPGPSDPSSVAWPYHSHVDEPADTNAGLVGMIVVTRKDAARSDGSPGDVDREFFSLFTVFDENSSLYLDRNVAGYAPGAVVDDPDFEESNLMHGINGLVYGNNTGYVMQEGDRVRWYILGMGTEVDLHTPHWHGATLLHSGNRVDVTEVLPAASKTLDMRPDNAGIWMFHCHVNDHILAGMSTTFTVRKQHH